MIGINNLETEDPTVYIVDQSDSMKHYREITGREWIIYGQCNACGACEDFAETEKFPSEQIKINKVKIGESIIEKTRRLVWLGPPGSANSCHEIGFKDRLDIPVTPNLVNNSQECSLSGEWINGH